METAVVKADVSHAEVARVLGINFSMASRLRSGKRKPSVDMIAKIEQKYRWKANLQVKAATEGTFGPAFERVLVSKYGAASE